MLFRADSKRLSIMVAVSPFSSKKATASYSDKASDKCLIDHVEGSNVMITNFSEPSKSTAASNERTFIERAPLEVVRPD